MSTEADLGRLSESWINGESVAEIMMLTHVTGEMIVRSYLNSLPELHEYPTAFPIQRDRIVGQVSIEGFENPSQSTARVLASEIMIDLTLLPLLLLATPSVISPLHLHVTLTGRPSLLDILLLCPGMQTPLSATALNEGEYPAVAAMTTGYVFRVENQAMVMFLQRVARTGHLVTLNVTSDSDDGPASGLSLLGLLPLLPIAVGIFLGPLGLVFSAVAAILLLPRFLLSLSFCFPALLLSYALMSVRNDWFLAWSVALLLLSRLLSILSLRAKTAPSWHGASEPGIQGDLLILLSQDRWVRMKGSVDDLKALTFGSWLREARHPALMEAYEWTSRVLVYLTVIVLGNAKEESKFGLIVGLFFSHSILMFSNSRRDELKLNGRKVKVSGEEGSIRSYRRRLDLAEELVRETGRSDWAIRLGMINPEETESSRNTRDPGHEIVTM